MFLIKLIILLSGGFNAAYSMDKNALLEQIRQRQEAAEQRSQQQIQQQKQELENFILGPITEQELKTTNAFQNSNLSQLENTLANKNREKENQNKFKKKKEEVMILRVKKTIAIRVRKKITHQIDNNRSSN